MAWLNAVCMYLCAYQVKRCREAHFSGGMHVLEKLVQSRGNESVVRYLLSRHPSSLAATPRRTSFLLSFPSSRYDIARWNQV